MKNVFMISIVVLTLTILLKTNNVFAVDAAIARKCSGLVAKAFPPREIGNPAAGSAKGSGRDEQDYFEKCIAAKGKMDKNPR